MTELFPEFEFHESEVPRILGLTYDREYLSQVEEAGFVAAIDGETWDTSWDRRRQPYGAAYGPVKDIARSIPAWGLALVERIFRAGHAERPYDQMLVNEYFPGQGIALHRD